MCPEEQEPREEKREVSREERVERIRRLISTHGQEAANLLRKWLQDSQQESGKNKG